MQKNAIRSFSDDTGVKPRQWKVLEIDADRAAARTYSRKDFYKICLATGKCAIHYTDRSFEADGTVLFFGNPAVPYSWEIVSSTLAGYTCLFSAEFLRVSERDRVPQHSPFFRTGGSPVLKITDEQRIFLNVLFEKMMEEQRSEYALKDEVVRNYINLILHEAIKMQPAENCNKQKNAASRITAVFLELLENQFPIESPHKPIGLKTAHDYAKSMSIHVNYLNRVVKKITGKPTSSLIADRIIVEAKGLLQHTHWNIADIAYALGFEYPSYFNNYFKRMTGTNPKSFRVNNV